MGSLVSPVAAVPLAELGRVHFTGIGGAGMSEAAARLGSRHADDRLAAEVMNIIASRRPVRSHAARGR